MSKFERRRRPVLESIHGSSVLSNHALYVGRALISVTICFCSIGSSASNANSAANDITMVTIVTA